MHRFLTHLGLVASMSLSAFAFNNGANTNLAVYWGQNSYGATHTSDTANWQQPIEFYCQDDTIDAFPIAFLNVAFDSGGLPSIDLANICNINDDPVFPGSELPNCSFLASGIETCQSMGKIVTISIGGATGAVSFTSDAQAQSFADQIWSLFLGGSSSTRPFGSAVLDGVDLDLEGGSQTGWPAFVTQIRSHAAGASKPYYITGAPQCPYPDAYIGNTINAVGFDALYVQFYNNYCGLTNFNNANDWNFATWDNWAKTVSPNPNVKIYIGAPASSTAAGSGYVDASTLASIISQTRSQYSSFGGVMLWDASQAYANNRYDQAVKSALTNGASVPPPPSSTKPPATTPAPTTSSTTSASSPTTTVGTSSCGVVAPWVANVAYQGGNQVTYNGHLWTAKWWSYGDTPGGSAGDWADDGPCATAMVAKTNYRTVQAHVHIPATAVRGHASAATEAPKFRFKRGAY